MFRWGFYSFLRLLMVIFHFNFIDVLIIARRNLFNYAMYSVDVFCTPRTVSELLIVYQNLDGNWLQSPVLLTKKVDLSGPSLGFWDMYDYFRIFSYHFTCSYFENHSTIIGSTISTWIQIYFQYKILCISIIFVVIHILYLRHVNVLFWQPRILFEINFCNNFYCTYVQLNVATMT